MAENSAIEWTDHTLNPWVGCFKVSPGCANCYAESWAKRTGRKGIWGPPATTTRTKTKGPWNNVYKWNVQPPVRDGRTLVFTASLADVFEDHPHVVFWRKQLMGVFERCTNLTFQVLTKRPENVMNMVPAYWRMQWPKNVWIGTSVENQETANERIPYLLNIPAPVRFLSCEPLLGPVQLTGGWHDWLQGWTTESEHDPRCNGDCREGYCPVQVQVQTYPVDWVIAGGESGPGKRPMDADWARAIRDECAKAGVPFFMKQMDKVEPIPDDLMIREFPPVAST